jgi:hypothetical protein
MPGVLFYYIALEDFLQLLPEQDGGDKGSQIDNDSGEFYYIMQRKETDAQGKGSRGHRHGIGA